VLSNTEYLIMHSSVITFEDNTVYLGTYTRGAGNSETFNGNAWVDVTGPPAQWQSGTDTDTMDERTVWQTSLVGGFRIQTGEQDVDYTTAELTGMWSDDDFVQAAANSILDVTITADTGSISVAY
jgi:hypothetical protein